MDMQGGRRFRLSSYGARLGTRLEGGRVRADLLREFAGLPPGGALVVDLAGMEVLSGSFSDEALVEAVAWLLEDGPPERYLWVAAPSLETAEDLGARLTARKLALLALVGRERTPRVLGHLPPYLQSAWQLVQERGALTSRELAEALGVSVQGAAVRLAELERLRLVALERETRAMGGTQNRAVALRP